MKKLKNSLRMAMAGSCFVLLMSCSGNPEFVEKPVTSNPNATVTNTSLQTFGFPLVMNRVDLLLWRTPFKAVTGTVTVQITNSTGTVLIGSTTVLANTIPVYGSNLNRTPFYFPNLGLESNLKYRIRVKLSNANDDISWIAHRYNLDNVDVYPKGKSNFGNDDFVFLSYSDGYQDQQQLLGSFSYLLGTSDNFWQEFVPSKIWVNGF